MKYRVTGADRDSGEEVELTLEAQNAEEASEKANRRGILVAAISTTTTVASPKATQDHKRLAKLKAVTDLIAKLKLKGPQVLSTAWSKPYGRIALIATPIILAVAAILVSKARNDVNAVYDHVRAQSDVEGKKIDRLVSKLEEQSEKDSKLAAEQRALAAKIRGESLESSPRRLTKKQAIENDAVVQGILDDNPDLESLLLNPDGTRLGITLNLLMTSNKLSISEVRYMQRFREKLIGLPE